jgi:cell division protein FtsB
MSRRMIGLLAASVILVGVLFVAGFPTSTWLHQKSDTARTQAQLDAVKAQRKQVDRQIAQLGTDEEIAKRAREDFGYVKPGEESYAVLPPAQKPIGLPDTWPFIGVERAIGAG